MSVFDLDTDGQTALEEEARLNPLDLSQVEAGFFDNTGYGTDMGIMRGGARVGQFIGMAAAAPVAAYERATDQEGRFTDPYFRRVDEYVNNAVDYWTPDAAEVGTAGRVLGGLSEMALPLMAGAGNPALLIGSQQMGVTTDLARQGVTPGAATAVGAVQGLSTAVGFKLPYLGNTLMQRIGSGAGGNLVTNIATSAGQQQILEGTGNEVAAEQFNPWDLEARAVDVLAGIAFGALAHVQMRPSDRAAVAAANNAKHFQSDTAPGVPADANAAVAHEQALESAIKAVVAGERVAVPDAVMQADFVPRETGKVADPPELQQLRNAGTLKELDSLAQKLKLFDDEPTEAGLRLEAEYSKRRAELKAPRNELSEDLMPEPISQARGDIHAPTAENATAGGEATAQTDPIITSARQTLADIDLMIPAGEIDADGNAKATSARDLMAQSDAEIQQAQIDARAFDAAVTCFLSKGAE